MYYNNYTYIYWYILYTGTLTPQGCIYLTITCQIKQHLFLLIKYSYYSMLNLLKIEWAGISHVKAGLEERTLWQWWIFWQASSNWHRYYGEAWLLYKKPGGMWQTLYIHVHNFDELWNGWGWFTVICSKKIQFHIL